MLKKQNANITCHIFLNVYAYTIRVSVTCVLMCFSSNFNAMLMTLLNSKSGFARLLFFTLCDVISIGISANTVSKQNVYVARIRLYITERPMYQEVNLCYFQEIFQQLRATKSRIFAYDIKYTNFHFRICLVSSLIYTTRMFSSV